MMSLKSEFVSTGNWLFKHRSFLPLLIIPLLLNMLLTPLNINIQKILLSTGLTVSLLGECIRIYTIAYVPDSTSGRNTNKQIASSLNTKGLYSVARHPLYLGNFLIYLGPFIFAGNINGIIIFILIFWIYYERIMYAEEAFLINKFEDKYKEWSSNTPAFIPNIMLFSPQNTKFLLTRVLMREYAGMCGIIFIFTLIISFRNYSFNITPILNNYWKILFTVNTLIYILLRTYKKTTQNNNK